MKRLFSQLLQWLRTSLYSLESTFLSFWHFVAVFASIMVVRILLEVHITGAFVQKELLFFFYEFVHISLLFFMMLLVAIFLLKTLLKIPVRGGSILVLALLLPLILLSPLIDAYLFSHIPLRSYYEFYSVSQLFTEFFTFMGHMPYEGTTPGQRAMIFLTLLLLLPFAYFRAPRQKGIRSVLAVFSFYILFYITVTLPSYVAILSRGIADGFLSITDIQIAQMFFSPLISPPSLVHVSSAYALHFKMILVFILLTSTLSVVFLLLYHRKVFLTQIVNIRPMQVAYHLGLFGFGMIVAITVRDYNLFYSFFNVLTILVSLLAITFAWYTSVIVNDISDQKIDIISNAKRPLPQKNIALTHYKSLALSLFLLSSFLMFFISVYAGFLLVGYHALTFLYSTKPFRLKRIPLVATAVCALSSLLIVFIGYSLAHPSHTILHFPERIGFLIFFALTLSLPLKDLKDVAGDRSDRVWTLPVIFGKPLGRILIGVGLFVSYMLSVSLFDEKKLFLHALIASAISFFILTARKKSSEVNRVDFLFSANNVPLFVFMMLLYYCGALITYLRF